MKTIIFLNGFAVPKFLAKTKLFWNDHFWEGYNRIYYTSKVPTSDKMVKEELDNLKKLISQYDEPIVAGHSLGAWWAANLACQDDFKTTKMVFWTPLGNHLAYPIFTASSEHLPLFKFPPTTNCGKDKVLLCYSSSDLIVPHNKHTPGLIESFSPKLYKLYGGHAFQINHKDGLSFMKNWIEENIDI
jgi:hypothetical protein